MTQQNGDRALATEPIGKLVLKLAVPAVAAHYQRII